MPAIRQRFGSKVRIIVRADSGFARDAIMAWCEDNGVFYCLGLARNDRLGEHSRGILRVSKPRLKRQKRDALVGVSQSLNTRLSTAGLKHAG